MLYINPFYAVFGPLFKNLSRTFLKSINNLNVFDYFIDVSLRHSFI